MVMDRRGGAGTSQPRHRTSRRLPHAQGAGYAYGDGENCRSYKCEAAQTGAVCLPKLTTSAGAFTACPDPVSWRARDITPHNGSGPGMP